MSTTINPQDFHILVVDDEPIIRQVITAALTQEGYNVAQADSGEKAFETLEQAYFNVVISDITMSKVSGIDLLFKVKEIHPDIEVILITGYASLDTAEAAVAGKAYRYLRKPFDDISDVVRVVEGAIETQLQKKKQEDRLQELISQRNRLEKRLGQVNTMYSISHSLSFPESPISLLREVAVHLFQVIEPALIACYIKEEKSPEIGGLFIITTQSFSQDSLEHLVENIHKEKDENTTVSIIDLKLKQSEPINKLDLIEITFPRRSILDGIIYVGFIEPFDLSQDDEHLLEVTTAQIAGALGKLVEFRRREQERLQSLIEGMADGVILFQTDGHINIANHDALQIFDVKTIGELEKKLRQLHLTEMFEQMQEGNWTIGKELVIKKEKTISVTVLPLENRKETGSMMVLRDISDQVKLQKELERTRRLSMIGELAAGVVHELNTPMTIILGYTQLIVDQPISQDVKRDITNIQEEAERCKKIVGNLLELAPSRNQRKSVINVRDIVNKVLELKGHSLRKVGISSNCRCTQPFLMAEADSGQIQQVLLNLVKNSQDAMESCEKDNRHLQINLEYKNNKIYVEVADTGPGIKEKCIDQIFNPFFTTKSAGKGTGLGLSISHKIIREHNGRLSCHNNSNGGASFVIELPAVEME